MYYSIVITIKKQFCITAKFNQNIVCIALQNKFEKDKEETD